MSTRLIRLLSLILLLLSTAPCWGESSKQLNVLFLIADDLGVQLGCYDHPLVQSPNIDRLAQQGVRFEHAYCQFPLCNPSRVSFLTGLRPDTTRIFNNGIHFREVVADTCTLPELFRKNGYAVQRVGKLYHYGVPTQIGTSGLDDPQSWDGVDNPRGVDRDEEPFITTLTPGQFGASLSWYASNSTDEHHTDGVGADLAINHLREYSQNPEKPFFLAVGFYRPHTPYVAPKKYFDLYPLDQIKLPIIPANHRDNEPIAAYFNQKKVEIEMSEETAKRAIQGYYAATSFMDAQVGRVVSELEMLGLKENTVIIMMSDHGYHLGEHELWQKRSLFEQVPQIPLIIIAPGAKGNGTSSPRIVESIDIYPTLADLCGLKAPDYLEGMSVKPLLNDPRVEWKKSAITQTWGNNFGGHSIRTEQFRYTLWEGGKRGEQLYDHTKDPKEYHNLANDPNYAAIKEELNKELLRIVDPHLKPFIGKNAN